jgi:hypothetical protein
MNTLAASVISALLVLAAGCASHRQAPDMSTYAENMAAMEKWISDSPTFAEFEKEVGMTQRPTFYTDMQFKKFTPAPGMDLVSMRSATRKSQHEVVIHGASRTRAYEGVQYWIVIDEAVESK